VHHYTVFVSQDGTNLMPLADVAAGTHTLNVGSYNLAAGNYTFFVKAVGQPSIVNHMSGAVPVKVSTSTPTPAPTPTQTTGVSVASPTNNWVGAASSPVHVVATAVGTANRPVTAMRIYVDDVSMYAINAAKLDTYLKLAAGSHHMVVQAWDNTGAVYKTLVLITLK